MGSLLGKHETRKTDGCGRCVCLVGVVGGVKNVEVYICTYNHVFSLFLIIYTSFFLRIDIYIYMFGVRA